MKKITAFLLFAALTLCMFFFTSCGDSLEQYVYKDGKIVSEDSSKSYIAAPMGFQPCGVGQKCAVRDGAFDLYQVQDINGKNISVDEWMTEEYAGSATSVYYRDTLTLPSFSEIDYDVCYVCEEDTTVVSIATIEDKDIIGTLISRIANGDSSFPTLDEPTTVYKLKFYSAEYPSVFYSIDYLIFEDGAYLFNRGTRTYAEASSLIDGYIDSAESTSK